MYILLMKSYGEFAVRISNLTEAIRKQAVGDASQEEYILREFGSSAVELAVTVVMMAVFAYIDGRPLNGEGVEEGKGGTGSGGEGKGETGAGGSESGGNTTNKIPDNNSIIKHIFRDAEGHISDTPQNRALLEAVSNNVENFLGIDKYGNEWYAEILEDGRQVWVETRNGNIFEGGINEIPKSWNQSTGLKKE